MKTLLSLVLFFLLHLCLSAQTWAPSGAIWRYSYYDYGVVGKNGYVEIKVTGDTLVGSIPAKKLGKVQYGWHDGLSYTSPLGTELTYELNKTVFIRNKSSWDTLYCFGAGIGATWRMPKRSSSGYACDSGTVEVKDTGSISLNGEKLRRLAVLCRFGSSYSYQDTILEKIGSVRSYLLEQDPCYGRTDRNEGGSFRCYEDPVFGLYKSPYFQKECNYINPVREQTYSPISLQFNVIRNKAYFSNLPPGPKIRYMLITLDGRVIQSGQMADASVDLSNCPAGIYVLRLQDKEGYAHFKLVKE